MTELQKQNVFNMGTLAAVIIVVAIIQSDPIILAFTVFPAIVAFINWKDI